MESMSEGCYDRNDVLTRARDRQIVEGVRASQAAV